MVNAVAAKLVDNGRVPKVIYSGPTLRTRQTAQRFLAAFRGAGHALPKVVVEDGLGPGEHRGHAGAAVLKKLADDPEVKRAMVVSHHDTLNKALASLNDVDPMTVPTFAKVEVRGIEFDRGTGEWEEDWCLLPSDVGEEDVYG